MRFYWVLVSTRMGWELIKYLDVCLGLGRVLKLIFIWHITKFSSCHFNCRGVRRVHATQPRYKETDTHNGYLRGRYIHENFAFTASFCFFVQIAHLIFCNPDITALPPVECRECVLEISVWKYKNVDSSFLNSPTLHMSIIEVIPCMSPVHRLERSNFFLSSI